MHLTDDTPGMMKNLLNQREREFFSPLAAFSDSAVRRWPERHTATAYRQEFSLDADRILHSLAYARYSDKTQVFSLIRNDHITHRVLHVQLVSRIARTIGRYLGLNEDLIEAASLGHDLGHPPFGHDGERILSDLCRQNNAGFFHHNLQSVRFMEFMERQGKGWNLTLQTLDAILCHNGEIHAAQIRPHRARTFEDLDRMMADMVEDPNPDLNPMTLEGCVVRLADTIAYIGRDMEDAIRLGIIKRSDLPNRCSHLLGETNGTIVHTLVTDLITSSMRQPWVGFSEPISEALKELRHFSHDRIYSNPSVKGHLEPVKTIYNHLFYRYLEDLIKEQRDFPVLNRFIDGMPRSYRDAASAAEIVRDFISGMTDTFFLHQAPESMRPGQIEMPSSHV